MSRTPAVGRALALFYHGRGVHTPLSIWQYSLAGRRSSNRCCSAFFFVGCKTSETNQTRSVLAGRPGPAPQLDALMRMCLVWRAKLHSFHPYPFQKYVFDNHSSEYVVKIIIFLRRMQYIFVSSIYRKITSFLFSYIVYFNGSVFF